MELITKTLGMKFVTQKQNKQVSLTRLHQQTLLRTQREQRHMVTSTRVAVIVYTVLLPLRATNPSVYFLTDIQRSWHTPIFFGVMAVLKVIQ